jgi:hypothetical protein
MPEILSYVQVHRMTPAPAVIFMVSDLLISSDQPSFENIFHGSDDFRILLYLIVDTLPSNNVFQGG